MPIRGPGNPHGEQRREVKLILLVKGSLEPG